MEEEMADVERKGVRVAPKEWVETQVLRTAEALGETIDYWKGLPRKTKLKLATSFVVPATLGIVTAVGAWRFYEGRVELPAIQLAEGKKTSLEVSQTQAETPKIITSSEKAPEYVEKAPPYQDFLIQIQAPEPIIPAEKPPEIESITTYEIQPGDTLISIAEKFNLPWQALYVKNFNLFGDNPSFLYPGDKPVIPSIEEVEFISQQLSQEGLTFEAITCEEPYYFPETGHYVKPPFLEFFRRNGGQETIGAPVSEPVGSGAQFFEKMALIRTGENRVEFMNIGEITVYILKDKEVPELGDFTLDERFTQFYQSHGGEEVFGHPITGLLEENGQLVQYAQNARLEWDEAVGQMKIGNLGREFAEGWEERQRQLSWGGLEERAFKYQPGFAQCILSLEDQRILFRARRALEEFLIAHPEVMNQPLIEQLRQENPEKLNELFTRAQQVMALVDEGFPQVYPDNFTEEAARDWRIFKYHWGGNSENSPIPTYGQVLGSLLKHYLDYESNLLVERALSEMPTVAKTINNIIEAKAEPEWFANGEIPLIPEDWHGVFVFAGGFHALGGGMSYYHPVLFGAYNEYTGSSPDDYNQVLEALNVCGAHELIHARIQVWSAFPFPEGIIQSDEVEQAGLILPENIREHLAHMSMSSLTAAGQEALDIEPGIEPRIIYIYSVLKRAGVTDPYKEIVRAALTSNSDRLWELYESMRNPEDLSLDELLRTNDPDSEFFYYSPEELETFRAEYFPYLGK